MVELIKEEPRIILDPSGTTMYSVYPAEINFGFYYHSHMIPPFKPNNMLMLGYGYGTIPELTRKIWGLDVKITGVDKALPNPLPYFEHRLLNKNALEFVMEEADGTILIKYDYICIDLWNGSKECDFIFDDSFVKAIHRICGGNTPGNNCISLNILSGSNDEDGSWDVFKEKLKSYYENFAFAKAENVGRQSITFWRKSD